MGRIWVLVDRPSMFLWRVAVAVVVLASSAVVAAAIEISAVEWLKTAWSTPGTGARQATRTIWDGVYTEDQAERGREVYDFSCVYCHRGNLEGGDDGQPALRGPYFFADWSGRTVAELFLTVSQTMPRDEAALDPQSYIDVIGFVFKANGVPASNTELPPDPGKLEQILITKKPARNEESISKVR